MQKILKRILLVITVMVITGYTFNKVNAQTPANLPGGGGAGTTTSSVAGDGAPEVPFDANLSLILVVGGILFVLSKIKRVDENSIFYA